MIKTTEFDGLYYIVEDGGGVTNISKPVFEAIKKQNDELSKFKSLVKTVDLDNLPECEVLAFNKDGYILKGRLYGKHNCRCESDLFETADIDYAELYQITHYILESDLIEVFNNAK